MWERNHGADPSAWQQKPRLRGKGVLSGIERIDQTLFGGVEPNVKAESLGKVFYSTCHFTRVFIKNKSSCKVQACADAMVPAMAITGPLTRASSTTMMHHCSRLKKERTLEAGASFSQTAINVR